MSPPLLDKLLAAETEKLAAPLLPASCRFHLRASALCERAIWKSRTLQRYWSGRHGTVLTPNWHRVKCCHWCSHCPPQRDRSRYAPSCVIERASCTDWNSWTLPGTADRDRGFLPASGEGGLSLGLVESGRNLATGYLPAVTSVILSGSDSGSTLDLPAALLRALTYERFQSVHHSRH